VISDLGDAVLRQAARSLKRQREALADQVDRFAGTPQPESPFRQDRRALTSRSKRTRARIWILDETMRQAGRVTSSAIDHTAGLEKCLQGEPESQFCTMTLGRGTLDAATRVCYLLDPAIDLSTRLLRGTALLIDSSEEEATAVNDMAPGELPPGAKKIVFGIRDNVQGWAATAGLDIRIGQKGKINGIAWDAASKAIPLKMNASSESAKYFPEVPAAYRMTSGVAHSMPWMLHDTDDRPSSVLMAQAAAHAALNGCIQMGAMYAGYYGHDFAEARRKGLMRCTGLSLMTNRYVAAGNHSLGRYSKDPRLQPPPA
jgi:hypothetical protein